MLISYCVFWEFYSLKTRPMFIIILKVLVLLILTFRMGWDKFLIIASLHYYMLTSLLNFVRKKPMPLVQFEAIFYLSLWLSLIIYSRHSLSYFWVRPYLKQSILDQFDIPHVILTTELGDLYVREYYNKLLIANVEYSGFWNYLQKDMYPRSLISPNRTNELDFNG